MGSGAGHLSSVMEAIHIEAQACLQAVHFAIQSGQHLIELETDCLAVKTALTSNAYDASTSGLIFREIKFLLQFNFINVKMSLPPCRRQRGPRREVATAHRSSGPTCNARRTKEQDVVCFLSAFHSPAQPAI